jgi:hypothetical protein
VCNVFSRFSDYFDGRNRASPSLDGGDDPGSGHHFNPNQPRVPKGNPEGGQWTDGGAGPSTPSSDNESRRLSKLGLHLASSEGPRGGWRTHLLLAFVKLFELLLKYRKENPPPDLFNDGDDSGSTVAITMMDGEEVVGLNSKHHDYTDVDRANSKRYRAVLIRKYPYILRTNNIGQMPNDGLFHAEANVLLRAAKKNGGTLAGKVLHVVTDRAMCDSCRRILPILGSELGDPTVIFSDPKGVIHEMRGGKMKRISLP